MSFSIEVQGSDALVKAIDMVTDLYPKDVEKFMRSEGNKLKRATVKRAKSMVRQHTGNLVKGIKRGDFYIYHATGAASIRVYAGHPANHAHLLEYGHDIVKGGKVVGSARAYHIFKTAADDFEDRYETDTEKFVDKIFENLDRE